MNKRTFRIAFVFTVTMFITFTITIMLATSIVTFLYSRGILEHRAPILGLFSLGLACALVGTVLSKLIGKRALNMILSINSATKEIASGNFNITLDEDSQAIELREIARNFNIMARELSKTEILRNDFIENVSHEFKTPLATIEGYATLIQDSNLSEEKRLEYATTIVDSTKRLSSLSGNILLLSRLENQETGLKKCPFELSEQIREAILSYESQWTEKDLSLDIDLDELILLGNEDLLFQVWQNILGNAIKFSTSKGDLSVFLKEETNFAVVTIADTGIGMNPDVCSRIFEKFYQGDTSRSSIGNGLGLSLAKRIIDLHSGSISVSSTIDEGSTFTIKIPMYK